MNNKLGLVLEGGGFRGLYTAGVLDCFLDKNIEFSYIIGVSMGANNASNYLSKQKKRSLNVPYQYINDRRYMSFARLFTQGKLFGMDFIFNDIPNKLVPFDYVTYQSSAHKLIFVTTDCATGKPFYIEKNEIEDSFKALQASISLPFVSKKVKLLGKELLDGGVCDPIPFKKAINDGCDKLVVILTQPLWYRKKESNFKLIGKLFYNKHSGLINALENRHEVYNNQLDELYKMQSEGKVFIIQPKDVLPITRIEKNKEKLRQTYEIGLNDGHKTLNKLVDFINY